MDPLFPPVPEDIKALSDEELAELIKQHEAAAELINADDQEFLGERFPDQIIEEYEKGVAQIKALREETAARAEAHENYKAKLSELNDQLKPAEVVAEAEEDDGGEEEGGEEAENGEEEEAEEAPVAEKELEPVMAAAEAAQAMMDLSLSANTSVTPLPVRYARTPPAPTPDRAPATPKQETGTALVASGEFSNQYREPLNPSTLGQLSVQAMQHYGPIAHDGKYVSRQEIDFGGVHTMQDGSRVPWGEKKVMVWDGPKHKIARADYPFPEDRVLGLSMEENIEKIRAVMPETMDVFGQPGGHAGEALVASGGLCAPLTPIYTMPNFATTDEPVWDALPKFRADRGGVNVPDATYIADITTAISSISEEEDALGGTFATKSCQDLTCPAYTETAVQILAHCREYGNLNARAWPEKIAHENALTMAALSRTSEGFLLDRIKALSVNVTNGGTGQGALIYLVEAVVRARFGLIGRFRMPRQTRFRWILPYWVPDIMQLDTISTQFDRFRSKESLVSYMESVGVDVSFYLDTPSTDTTQLPDATQAAAAIDSTPANIQSAFYPEGAFLGLDMGTLELGIVRDSTLNATNDFQVFGERFRNVARIAPAQAAYWITTTYCAAGIFPALGTARTCP